MRLVAASKVLGSPGKWFARFKLAVTLVKGPAGAKGAERVVRAAKALERRCGQSVGMIVIDTLARAIPGDDENAVSDMMAFAEGRAAEIARQTGAAVLVAHHPNAQGRMRGSTSLPGAFDVILRIDREAQADRRTLVAEKVKDGKEGPLFDFELPVVELGTYKDGKPVTSCTVRKLPLQAKADKPAQGTKGERVLQRAFDATLVKARPSGNVKAWPPKETMPDGNGEGWKLPADVVRVEFSRLYATGNAEREQAQKARRTAWVRIVNAPPAGIMFEVDAEGNEWAWRRAAAAVFTTIE